MYSLRSGGSSIASVIFLLCFLALSGNAFSQDAKGKKEATQTTKAQKVTKTGFDTVAITGLKFRSIGPSLTSGRISDIAVDPL